MADYKEFMEILHGSHRFEFDDMKLTLTGYWSGTEASIDFMNMNGGMYEELMDEDSEVGYDDAVRILGGSKSYEFEGTVLSVTGYRTGKEVRLDLGNMTEEMYDELKVEEELDDDMEDGFADAVEQIGQGDGPSL